VVDKELRETVTAKAQAEILGLELITLPVEAEALLVPATTADLIGAKSGDKAVRPRFSA
jgi:hypothetical protein